MSMHEMGKDPRPGPQPQPARWWVSASAGTAAAAALVALIAPVVLWATRSPQDFLPGPRIPFLTISASVIGGVVLLVLAVREKTLRSARFESIAALTVIIGVVAAVVCVKTAAPLVPAGRGWLPMVDTTGSAGVAVFAVVAAVIALVMMLPAGLFSRRRMSPRVLLWVFVVAALFFSSWGYNVVEAYRQSVWNPALTAAATPAAPLPEVVGPIGYRIAVGPYENYRPLRAGNGFLHLQYDVLTQDDVLTAYDGPTGDIRWQVDLSRKTRPLVISGSNGAGDSVDIVVLVQEGALVALEGSSGNVLWRRHYDGDPDLVTGTVDAVAFTEGSGYKRVDPVTGQLQSSTVTTGTLTENRWGGVYPFRDPTLGSDVDVFFTKPTEPTMWKPAPSDTTTIVERGGTTIDQIAGARPLSAARDGFLLLITSEGTLLMRDYRSQTSTRVPLDLRVSWGQSIGTAWLSSNRLAVAQEGNDDGIEPSPVYLIDAAHADAQPVATEAPCYPREDIVNLLAVPGAVVVSCRGSQRGLVGLVPPQPS